MAVVGYEGFLFFKYIINQHTFPFLQLKIASISAFSILLDVIGWLHPLNNAPSIQVIRDLAPEMKLPRDLIMSSTF